MGARVRVQATASQWVKGMLVGADSAGVTLVPEGAPPLGPNQLRLPTASLARFELATGTKRHWLAGLVIGAAAGAAMGFAFDVDPVACQYDDTYFCSRGEAVALGAGTFGVIGAGVGALVKTERWTPIALDALAPPQAHVSGIVPQLRALPGGIGLGLAVGF
jgi:hypothetical protein